VFRILINPARSNPGSNNDKRSRQDPDRFAL
jgi:hypothetical protein